jgi:adenylate cyclase
MPGVEVWAQSLESMLTGNLLLRPRFLNLVEIAITLIAGLVIVFVLPYGNPRIASAALVSIVVILFGVAFASFKFSKLLLDGAYPALSSMLVFGVMLSENLRVAEADLRHEREMEARIDGELNAARSIQLGLLPRKFPGPPERSDVEVFASIEPSRMVGGDLYDFALLDSNLLSFAIADVSGKGVPAALFMAVTKEVLHTATLRYRDALDRVFNDANEKIAAASEELGAGGANVMFVTVFAGILDLASGALVYVNAGHDAPFVIRAGAKPERLALAGGPPLGTVDDFQYSFERRQLVPGEMLLAYTDGVTEAQDKAHTLYSMARLEQVLATAPAGSAKAVVELVDGDVHRFAAGAEQADDITRDRAGADAVVYEPVANHLRAAHRKFLIVLKRAERVRMPDHFDLVHRAPLYIVKHRLVLALGVGRQDVAVLFEVEHEMTWQDRLRRQRVAEDLLDLSLIDFCRRGDATAHLARCVGFVQLNLFLAVVDRDRAGAAIGIGQHDKQRLPART